MGHPGIGEFLYMQQLDLQRRATAAAGQAESRDQTGELEREHQHAALVLRVVGRAAR